MTFQVAFVGSDGLIAGSDRKFSIRNGGYDSTITQFGTGSKFVWDKNESIVCMHAGGPVSSAVADKIVSIAGYETLWQAEWRTKLREIAQAHSTLAGDKGEVHIFRKDSLQSVLRVISGRDASVGEVGPHFCAGATLPAVFLAHHFWRNVPVESLRRLVLLCLSFALDENKDGVGEGFDVMTWTQKDGLKWDDPYSAEDSRITEIRNQFERVASSAIYPTEESDCEVAEPPATPKQTWEEFRDARAARLHDKPAGPPKPATPE